MITHSKLSWSTFVLQCKHSSRLLVYIFTLIVTLQLATNLHLFSFPIFLFFDTCTLTSLLSPLFSQWQLLEVLWQCPYYFLGAHLCGRCGSLSSGGGRSPLHTRRVWTTLRGEGRYNLFTPFTMLLILNIIINCYIIISSFFLRYPLVSVSPPSFMAPSSAARCHWSRPHSADRGSPPPSQGSKASYWPDGTLCAPAGPSWYCS